MTSHWRLHDCGCGDGCGEDDDDGYDDHGYEDSAVGRRNRKWGPLEEKPWK